MGLQAARKAVFSGIPWQRCQFHLQQNASQYVPRQSMKREVVADIRAIFNAPSREQAEVQLRRIVEKYAKRASRLARRQYSGRIDNICFPDRSPAQDPHCKQFGAGQSRNS